MSMNTSKDCWALKRIIIIHNNKSWFSQGNKVTWLHPAPTGVPWLRTPATTCCPATCTVSGPPLSPWHPPEPDPPAHRIEPALWSASKHSRGFTIGTWIQVQELSVSETINWVDYFCLLQCLRRSNVLCSNISPTLDKVKVDFQAVQVTHHRGAQSFPQNPSSCLGDRREERR